MDVQLSEDALLFLKAQALEGSGNTQSGLLLGHKRGRRFFVEQVYPSGERAVFSERTYWTLDRLFGGKIIGFYSFASRRRQAPKILKPFACGKVFLSIVRRPKNRWTIKPQLIEFKDSFVLLPIPLHSRSKGKK
jgi:hypothetical protein